MTWNYVPGCLQCESLQALPQAHMLRVGATLGGYMV